MSRKPSPLSGALSRPRLTPEALVPEATTPTRPAAKPRARGVFLGGYVDETTKRQFKVLLAERGLTEQKALEEMLDDFFGKYGKHRIAARISDTEG